MPDSAHPNATPANDWNVAFAALPPEMPPVDGWSRLSAALDARVPASRARARQHRWLALAAALAAVALVPVMLMRDRGVSEPSVRVTAQAPAKAATSPVTAATPVQATAPAAIASIDRPAASSARSIAPAGTPADTPADVPVDTPLHADAVATATKAPAHATARHASPRSSRPAIAAAPGRNARRDATNDHADALLQLQAESARLEALIAMTRDDRVGSAAATVMTAELDQRIGLIDTGLTQGATSLTTDQREALWRERVQTLRELAGVETTQLWLATQGERYDGALVSVD